MLPRFAWHVTNAGNQAHPVGQLKPNDFGLFDMLGNAYEWVQDPYEKYQIDQGDRPVVDAEKHAELSDKIPRVLRGGAMLSAAHNVRSAARIGVRPSDRSEFIVGFRPARTHAETR
jgi:formylglycine-generating enzyme required for sulfatase activity